MRYLGQCALYSTWRTRVPGEAAHVCRGVEGGKVQSVPWLLDRTGQLLPPAGTEHLDEEPGVQVQGVALVLGAVVLGGHVRTAHQLPAAGVEVPQDAGGGG